MCGQWAGASSVSIVGSLSLFWNVLHIIGRFYCICVQFSKASIQYMVCLLHCMSSSRLVVCLCVQPGALCACSTFVLRMHVE